MSNYVNGNQCQHSVHVIIEATNFSKAKVLIKNRYQARVRSPPTVRTWDFHRLPPRVAFTTRLTSVFFFFALCCLILNSGLIIKRTCASGCEGPSGCSWSSLISVCSLNLTAEQLQPTTVHDQTKIQQPLLGSALICQHWKDGGKDYFTCTSTQSSLNVQFKKNAAFKWMITGCNIFTFLGLNLAWSVLYTTESLDFSDVDVISMRKVCALTRIWCLKASVVRLCCLNSVEVHAYGRLYGHFYRT